MSDVMAANPQHYSMGGFSYGTLCNATASPVPPSQMGVCELFNQRIPAPPVREAEQVQIPAAARAPPENTISA